MTGPPHPNLARMAGADDEIVARRARGEMSPGQAQREVEALVARDDNGIRWSISPTTGRWQYRALNGELENADPPSSGLPGVTPWQMGSGAPGDPDQHLSLLFHSSLQAAPQPRQSRSRAVRGIVAAALAAGAVLSLVMWVLRP